MTAVVAAQIDHWRGVRGLSAQKLADRTAQLGMHVARNTIANLENGRRGSVSVAEVLVLAAALDVAPALILLPLGRAADVEVLPGRAVTTWEAHQWLIGDWPLGTEGDAVDGAWVDAAAPIGNLRQHDHGTRAYEDPARQQWAIKFLQDIRRTMRAAGEVLPELPPAIARDLGEATIDA